MDFLLSVTSVLKNELTINTVLIAVCILLVRGWLKHLLLEINFIINRLEYFSDKTDAIHSGLSSSLNGKYASGYKENYEKTLIERERFRQVENQKNKRVYF